MKKLLDSVHTAYRNFLWRRLAGMLAANLKSQFGNKTFPASPDPSRPSTRYRVYVGDVQFQFSSVYPASDAELGAVLQDFGKLLQGTRKPVEHPAGL